MRLCTPALRMLGEVTHVDQIDAEPKMRALLFQNTDRQKARRLRLVDGLTNSGAVSSSHLTES